MLNDQLYANALRRINKDLEELKREPIEGVGLARYNPNEELKFLVNFKIMYGIFEGIILQLQMEVPRTYPINPPKMLILPSQGFSHTYHHHIFDDVNDYKKFCIDILENNFLNTKTMNTGWSPGYTFKTLFFQIQNFLADPDGSNPSKSEVDLLRKTIENYSCSFVNEEGLTVTHTYENPYPPLGKDLGKEANTTTSGMIVDNIHQENYTKERLTCYLLKNNFIEDNSIILGYPVRLAYDFKKRIEPHPIPEILSFEGYKSELVASGLENEASNFNIIKFKTCMGQEYNYWFPIYINEEHFINNKKIILNSFKLGKGQFNENTDTKLILEIMPAILSKMIIFLLKGESHMSLAAIEAYCHFLQLFKRLLIEFPKLFDEIEVILNSIRQRKTDKSIFPDVGNLIVILYLSNQIIGDDLIFSLLDEYFTRQIYWIFNRPQYTFLPILKNDNELKKPFINVNKNSVEYLQDKLDKLFNKHFAEFYSNKEAKCFGIHVIENPPNLKNKTLKKHFEECKKLYYEIEKTKNEKTPKLNVDIKAFESYIKDNFKEDKITLIEKSSDKTKLEIIRTAFEGQLGNHLLLFTYSAALKFINPSYIEKLNSNYSVIEENDAKSFIEPLNEMKNEVNDYEKLVNVINCGKYFNEEHNMIHKFMFWIANSNEKKYTNYRLPENFKEKYFH